MGIISAIKAYLNVMDIDLSIKSMINSENYEIKALSRKQLI